MQSLVSGLELSEDVLFVCTKFSHHVHFMPAIHQVNQCSGWELDLQVHLCYLSSLLATEKSQSPCLPYRVICAPVPLQWVSMREDKAMIGQNARHICNIATWPNPLSRHALRNNGTQKQEHTCLIHQCGSLIWTFSSREQQTSLTHKHACMPPSNMKTAHVMYVVFWQC